MGYVMGERWTPIYDRMFDPDHELAGGPVCQRWAFADLCHMAQWKDGKRIKNGTVIDLPRGSFLASIRYLARRWNWPKSRVSRFLDALQSDEIEKLDKLSETRFGTVYVLVNYDTYANPRDSKRDGAKTELRRSEDKEQQVPVGTEEEDKPPIVPLWETWVEEVWGGETTRRLTSKRRKKLEMAWKEHLESRDDPVAFFRKMVQAMLADDWWGPKDSTHVPEKAMRNAERREEWAVAASNGKHRPSEGDTQRQHGGISYVSRDEL